eukprot:1252457-Amphidinium_carterae.1
MERAGYTVLWGSPPPTRLSKRNREYLAWGGVAIAVKSHWSITEIAHPDGDVKQLHDQGRFVSAEVISPSDHQRLQVHVLYVTADPHMAAEQKWQVNTALAFAVAHGWYQRYAFLAGDYNKEKDQAPLFELLEDGALSCPFDILGVHRKDGLPGERKIDHILCSPPMTDLLCSADVIPFAPFPGHTPVTCGFSIPPPVVQPRLALPQPLPVQHLPDYPAEPACDWPPCRQVDQLIERHLVDEAFDCWTATWEDYLVSQCDANTVMSSHTGRGSCDGPAWKVPSAQLRPMACYDRHLHGVVTLEKRFEALAHTPEYSDDAADLRLAIRRIWSDLQHTEGFPPWPLNDMAWESAAWSCHAYLTSLKANRQRMMLERWRDSHQLKCDPYSVRSHRYVAGKCKVKPFRGLMVDGVFQVNSQVVDEALRCTWQRIHRLNGTDASTLMTVFENKYAELVPAGVGADHRPLGAQDLISALKRTKPHTAAGPCGWRATELKKLPMCAWVQLSTIFNLAESRGRLPRLCQILWQAAVPKTDDLQVPADGVRPIAIYSLLYRLYAKARYVTLKYEFQNVIYNDQYGGLAGRQLSTPVLCIAKHLDRSRVRPAAAHGADGMDSDPEFPHWITYDLTKAFDTVLPQLACRILEISGYNEAFLRTYLHHLTHNVRRWKLPHRGLGQQWYSHTGIAQGCPLSSMAAVAVYGVMTRHILRRAQQAGARVRVLSYIDDFNIGTADLLSLDVARKAMDEVVSDFGLSINAAKTKVVSKCDGLAGRMADVQSELPYCQVEEQKVLGVILGVGACVVLARLTWLLKLAMVCERIVRVAHLPVAYWAKVKLIETNAVAVWRFIPLSCPLAWHEYGKILKAIMVALGNGTTRAPALAQEILFVTQAKLHVAHPGYAHLYALCRLYRQHVSKVPSDMVLDWSAGDPHSLSGSVRHLCAYLKLTLTSDGSINSRAGTSVHMTAEDPDAVWLHNLREFFRRHELAALQQRRPREFDGVLHIDIEQVRRCLSRIHDPLSAGIARKFVGGGIMTRDRFSRHSRRGVRFLCETCQEPDSTFHVLWECGCLAHKRELQVTELPPRTCVAAAGLPAPGEMTDVQLTALYMQVVAIIIEYEALYPRASWKHLIVPAAAAAPRRIRLNGKTPPPPGGWTTPIVPVARLDTGGHDIEHFNNDKGKEAIRCRICRRQMLA